MPKEKYKTRKLLVFFLLVYVSIGIIGISIDLLFQHFSDIDSFYLNILVTMIESFCAVAIGIIYGRKSNGYFAITNHKAIILTLIVIFLIYSQIWWKPVLTSISELILTSDISQSYYQLFDIILVQFFRPWNTMGLIIAYITLVFTLNKYSLKTDH